MARRKDVLVLFAFVGAYVGASFYLSYLRFEEFSTSNWDLGIFQQALWSTSHGHLLYEAGDWETYGARSFLQIHPAFSLILLTPVYALAPSASTLFAVQSLAVGAAAFPLYGIAMRVLHQPRPSLAITGLYLVTAPLLLANLYDFHLELFLPIEIALLFYLWLGGRYRLGLVVALVTLLTIELAPFLVAFLALFFLLPSGRVSARRMLTWIRHPRLPRRPAWDSAVAALRRWSAGKGVRWSLLLLALAAASYPLLRIGEWYLLPGILPPAPNPSYSPAGLAVSGSGLGIGIDGAILSSLGHKLGFWLFLVGLFGFLPLLAPRPLLLVLPWFVFTIQSGKIVWTTLGFQYAAIPVMPLAIAAVFGYAAAYRVVEPRVARAFLPSSVSSMPTAEVRSLPRNRSVGVILRRRVTTLLALGVVVVLVAVNIMVGPANPANQGLSGPLPGFNVRYDPPAGLQWVEQLVSLIPTGAGVLASTDLFPLVANNVNAYSLMWTADQPGQTPFGPGHPAEYVLLATNQLFAVPPWLADAIAHRLYGLRGMVQDTPVGPVYLWLASYTGPTEVFGPN